MSAQDNGGSAFPEVPGDFNAYEGRAGMTLRDYFAAHASDEDVACAMYDLSASGGLEGLTTGYQRRAAARLAVADAMLAERAK